MGASNTYYVWLMRPLFFALLFVIAADLLNK